MLHTLRTLRGAALRSAAWRPSNARMLAAQVVNRARNSAAGFTDADHLRAAADWLARAQDASGDGGVSGRYLLREGWSSSYPETTGYIIPTFLGLASELGDERFIDRARRCVDFLASVRLPNGAFPGGEVSENRTKPSVFNTAQIVNGLVSWHEHSGEQRALDMATSAGDWLVSVMDDDGVWRSHIYRDTPVAYASHASCWLAQLGVVTGDQKYLEAARRNMEWVLSLQDSDTGWFDRAGWDEAHFEGRRAETHTIAYTIWGVLYTAVACGDSRAISAARAAAAQVARRLELSRVLPGKLDSRWRARATYQCLTGNAQMALIWMRLDEIGGEPALVNSALKAIDLVKAAQPMTNAHPGIRGGVPGSDPIWGDYIAYALPNWAAKFHVDALLAKKAALERFRRRPARDAAWQPPAAIPLTPQAPASAAHGSSATRVVMFTRPGAQKMQQMLNAWSWGLEPIAVVVETGVPGTLRERAATRIRENGFRPLLEKLRRLASRARDTGQAVQSQNAPPPDPSVAEYCAQRGIPMVQVASLQDEESLELVRALKPDLGIHAGGGILRPALLAILRIGTVNAHMGILPRYRGMNVAEWARILGGPTGCSVHFIDAGIDTGDIICLRRVNTDRAASIAELRALIDKAQIHLLGQVVECLVRSGTRPATYEQQPAEGVQFFRLHPDVAAILEGELRER